MRILIIHNRYRQRGGEEAVVERERELLQDRGHEAPLLLADNDAIEGIAGKVKAALSTVYSFSARRAVAERIADERPDLVHVHNFFPLLSPSVYDACRAALVPVVQTLHNYRPLCANPFLFRDGGGCSLCVDGSPLNAVRYGCYRGSRSATLPLTAMIAFHRYRGTWRRKVDRFITPCERTRQWFVRGGFPADRIVVKPNFVAAPPAPDAGERRGALFVGRLSVEKGVRPLIEAWRDLPYPLTVVGAGPLEETLRREAPPSVTFTGALPADKAHGRMASAAFLMMPSLWHETFGLVIVEAFARGTPVIASRLGAMEELVEHGETGLLVPPGDPAALREAASRLANDPAQARRMGANARRVYEERYTPEANYRALMAVYEAARGG